MKKRNPGANVVGVDEVLLKGLTNHLNGNVVILSF